MGWRFRQAFTPIPGVRITLSPRGISTSVGYGPARFTVGPNGAAITAHIPGTGISYRHQLSSSNPKPAISNPENIYISKQLETEHEIKSSDVDILTTPGLSGLREHLLNTFLTYQESTALTDQAISDERNALIKYVSWRDGYIFKHIFKKKFTDIQADYELKAAKRIEYQEQLELSKTAMSFDLPNDIAVAYEALKISFNQLSNSHAVWDITSSK